MVLNGAALKQIIMNVNWPTCLQSGEITSHYKHIMFQAIPHSCSLLMMWVNSLNMSLMGRGFSLYKMAFRTDHYLKSSLMMAPVYDNDHYHTDHHHVCQMIKWSCISYLQSEFVSHVNLSPWWSLPPVPPQALLYNIRHLMLLLLLFRPYIELRVLLKLNSI